jgi:hypothetical protein
MGGVPVVWLWCCSMVSAGDQPELFERVATLALGTDDHDETSLIANVGADGGGGPMGEGFWCG